MWLVQVSGFDLIFDVSAVSLEIGWVHGGGYREAVGAAAGAVAGPLPNTAALQALTGAMDKLEALFRCK